MPKKNVSVRTPGGRWPRTDCSRHTASLGRTWRRNVAFCISSRGQAMTEYVIIAGVLMASLGILTVFFVAFKEYGGRILALVSSEYP